jgi:hypothetical protein
MKTVAKLGRKAKKKYLEYRDLSDEEVGRLIKARFPGSYDDYVDMGLSQLEVQPELKQSKREVDIEESIQKIRSGDFKTGWAFFNRIRRDRIISYAEIKAAENAVADQLIESEAKVAQARAVKRQSEVILYEMKMQEQMRDAMHALSLLKIKVEGTLLAQAAEQGLTLEAFQVLKLEEAKSSIKVNEHRAMKQVDLEAWLLEKNADIKAALISTLLPHYQAKVLTEDIFKLLDGAYQLQISNDPQKEEKLKVIQKQIKKLKKVVDGKQGLLQRDNG